MPSRGRWGSTKSRVAAPTARRRSPAPKASACPASKSSAWRASRVDTSRRSPPSCSAEAIGLDAEAGLNRRRLQGVDPSLSRGQFFDQALDQRAGQGMKAERLRELTLESVASPDELPRAES